jgi:hypothetical protein
MLEFVARTCWNWCWVTEIDLGKRTTPTVTVCLRSATWPEMTPNDDVHEQILIWTHIEA